MQRILLSTIVVIGLLFMSTVARADNYEGWGDEPNSIRTALLDGDGAEFVVEEGFEGEFYPTELELKFFASIIGVPFETEFDKVLTAAYWVAIHMGFEEDPDGDVWTSSDQQSAEITPWVIDSGTGDCEDFAILLCALMRFSVGVPANRVWVQGGLMAVPGAAPEITPPTFGHVYVGYKSKDAGIYYIEPQAGLLYRGSLVIPSFDIIWGQSAQLKFNDEWVKGGGPNLAGRGRD